MPVKIQICVILISHDLYDYYIGLVGDGFFLSISFNVNSVFKHACNEYLLHVLVMF